MGRVFVGAVIGATGIALAAPFSHVGARAAASTATVYAAATTGVAAPSHAAPAPAGQSTLHGQRGVRSTPRSNTLSPTAGAPVASSAVTSVATSLLHNFNGVSSNDSRVTNFNQQFEPPIRACAPAMVSCSKR
jgi:hypothetical protein